MYRKEEENILNVYKKSGSILILTMVVFMFVLILTASILRNIYLKKNNIVQYKNTDMYYKNGYEEILNSVNNYFAAYKIDIDALKEKDISINKTVEFFYNSSINKFCIQYEYNGSNYKRILKVKEVGEGRYVFIPFEKKYLG